VDDAATGVVGERGPAGVVVHGGELAALELGGRVIGVIVMQRRGADPSARRVEAGLLAWTAGGVVGPGDAGARGVDPLEDAAGEVEALRDPACVRAVDRDQAARAVARVAGDVAGGIGVGDQAARAVVDVVMKDGATGERLFDADKAAETVDERALRGVGVGRRGVQIFVVAGLRPQRAVGGLLLATVGVALEDDAAERVALAAGARPARREDHVGAGVQGVGGERLAFDLFGDCPRRAVDVRLGEDGGLTGVVVGDPRQRAAEAVEVLDGALDVGLAAGAAQLRDDGGAGARGEVVAVAAGREISGVAGQDLGGEAAEAVEGESCGRAARGGDGDRLAGARVPGGRGDEVAVADGDALLDRKQAERVEPAGHGAALRVAHADDVAAGVVVWRMVGAH
jgi:hypothetical protein